MGGDTTGAVLRVGCEGGRVCISGADVVFEGNKSGTWVESAGVVEVPVEDRPEHEIIDAEAGAVGPTSVTARFWEVQLGGRVGSVGVGNCMLGATVFDGRMELTADRPLKSCRNGAVCVDTVTCPAIFVVTAVLLCRALLVAGST